MRKKQVKRKGAIGKLDQKKTIITSFRLLYLWPYNQWIPFFTFFFRWLHSIWSFQNSLKYAVSYRTSTYISSRYYRLGLYNRTFNHTLDHPDFCIKHWIFIKIKYKIVGKKRFTKILHFFVKGFAPKSYFTFNNRTSDL